MFTFTVNMADSQVHSPRFQGQQLLKKETANGFKAELHAYVVPLFFAVLRGESGDPYLSEAKTVGADMHI